MSKHLNGFKDDLPLGCSDNMNLVGLEIFKKKLEKYFYAQINFREFLTEDSIIELVIEVDSPFSFALSVDHFRIDVLSNTGENAKFLVDCLAELQKTSSVIIDIKELSFFLSDTSIIIQKVSNFSIVNHFDNIMRLMMNEYNFIISEIKNIPSEIHVPVLEIGEKNDKFISLLGEFPEQASARDYFNYWCLDFDSFNESIIYDLEKSNFLFDELTYMYD